MTRKDIINYLQNHYEEFSKSYGVDKIGLFGSFARNEANRSSDIDIFVDMKPSIFNLIAIKEKIESDLKRKVDIVRNHKGLKPILKEMINKDLIYAKRK